MQLPSNNQRPDSSGFFWVFEQMFRLPVAAFVYTMEMLVKTMQGLQHLAENGTGAQAHPNAPTPPPPASVPTVSQSGPQSQTPGADNRAEPIRKETTKMPDTNLNDDMLKLVRYKILFVKREYETAFQEREDLVADNMSSSAFTAWKIAEFMQNIGKYDLPGKWRDRNYPDKSQLNGDKLKGLPEEDKKYLRVYYEVLERYPREKFKYEEQQIEILRDISKGIKEQSQIKSQSPSGSQASSSGSASPGKTV